jgi:hypothetical protein
MPSFVKGSCMNRHHFILRLFWSLALVVLAGCERESWDLVSPPPSSDSIMVRLVNMTTGGSSYALQLDAIIAESQSPLVAPLSSSPLIVTPGDSAYVRVLNAAGTIVRDQARRTRFTKRTYETHVLLSSPRGQPDADTLVRLVTNPTPLPAPGRTQLRVLNAVPDTIESYEVRLGCPSGEFFDRQPFRGIGSFRDLASGPFVVSILKGSRPVAIVRGVLPSQRFATLIIGGTPLVPRVFLLDELNSSPNALVELAIVPEAERTAEIRWMNVSRYTFDSIAIASLGTVITRGQARWLSEYQRIPACSDVLSDTIKLYSNGVLTDAQPISIEVGSRYTIIIADAPNFGAPAAQLAIIERDRSTIPSDSTEWRVLNASGRGQPLTALLGARMDQRGNVHNGEYLVSALGDGSLSRAVRLAAGQVPLILRSGIPERITAVAYDTVRGGHQYTLAVLASESGMTELYTIADDEASGIIAPLDAGVFVQVVNAFADRALMNCSFSGGLKQSGVSPSNLVATVLPSGHRTVSINGMLHELVLTSGNVVTVIAAGTARSPYLIVLDSASLQPTTFVARVRCVNAAPDVPSLRMARDQLASLDQWDSNIFADRIAYGFASRPVELNRLQRINLVFGTADSPPKELLRPDGSVSFTLGKAYTVVFFGTEAYGYNYFILQEP